MGKLILGIDQGTTSTKVLVMDEQLNVVAEHSTPFEQHFPSPGQVEHDPKQIWESTLSGIQAIAAKVNAKEIVAIGITNQRETVCFWNRKTGEDLSRALVWQDRRTADRCAELKKSGFEENIQNETGLLLDPYFSATKMEWMIKNHPAVKTAASEGTLAMGTIDTYLLYKLTSGKSFATEGSNASRTLLFSLSKKDWSPDLLATFGVKREFLAEIKPTFGHFGVTHSVSGLPDGIPITGMIGDQQSALLGQGCIEKGQAKCTYGTGAFLLMNTGSEIRKSHSRLLSTVAWINQKNEATYALEGSAFMAGATIQWLRDGLKMISSSSEIEPLAREVTSSEGVCFVPAFTGLGAPYWDPTAKAAILGLTRGSTKAHIARAALEGIAFQNVDILQAMEKDLGAPIAGLGVDGGACKNNLLMQIQADLLGRKIRRPKMVETTAMGAIFAAGLGAKIWTDLTEIQKVGKLDREFSPEVSEESREERMKIWKKAVDRVLLR